MRNLERYKQQVKQMSERVKKDPQLRIIYRDVNFNRIFCDIEDMEQSYNEPFRDLSASDQETVKQLFGC